MSSRLSRRARTLTAVLTFALGTGTAAAFDVLPIQDEGQDVQSAVATPISPAPGTDAGDLAVDTNPPAWADATRPEVPGEAATIAAVSASVGDFAARKEQERAEAEYAASRGAIWDRLADCESGDWDRNSNPIPGSRRWDYGLTFSHGDIFEGGLNFHPKTWEQYRSSDMPGHAGHATRAQQIRIAEKVLADQGWGAWPVCSRKLGYR